MNPKSIALATQGATKSAEPSRTPTNKELQDFCRAATNQLGQTLGTALGELEYALTVHQELVRKHSIEVALGAAERSLNLIKDIRYFAERPRLSLKAEDASEIVMDTTERLEKEFEAKHIRLKVLAETPAIVMADRGAFQHALLNVLLADIQETPFGGDFELTLKVRGRAVEIESCHSSLPTTPRVTPEQVLLYGQMSQSPPPPELWSLGLGVAKALIESHQGAILSQGQPGEAFRTLIHLPHNPDQPPPDHFPGRRSHSRVSLRLPGELRLKNHRELTCVISELSAGGAFVTSLIPGTGVRINDTGSLTLSYFSPHSINIELARIAHISTKGSEKGIGLEFLKVGPKAKRILSGLVKGYAP